MDLYFVSMIIQETENSKPWLCAATGGFISQKEAEEVISKRKDSYRLLSAWIDKFDMNNVKSTVFHECYI